MVIKLINKIKEVNENNSYFSVEPFEYQGKLVSRIKVANGSRGHYSNLEGRWVEINLQEDQIEGIEEKGYGVFLKIKGDAEVKSSQLPSELHFKLAKKEKWESGIERKVNLDMETNSEWLVKGHLNPKIAGFQLDFRNDDKRDEFLNSKQEGEEYTIRNIDWNSATFMGTTSKHLNLNCRGGQPIIESEKEKQAVSDQASQKAAASKKVGAAVTRAREAKERLFKSGYINESRKDFEEAVRAISELIKIAKNGNEEEKKEFATFLDWQIDGSQNGFSGLKGCIHYTSLNNKQGWTYNLDTGEINWGSTGQATENNHGQEAGQNDNDKSGKRKNDENDNNGRETKRAKVEEEVQQELAQEEAKADKELVNNLAGLANKTEQEKEQNLAEIEKKCNQGGTYEAHKEEIKAAKDELAKNDPQGYARLIARVIQQKIAELKVEVNKLGQEIKEKLTRLQNGEFTSDSEVRAIEEEVNEKVSEEAANVEVNDWLNQAQKLLNGAASNLKSELEKVKKGLYSVKLSKNPYQQKAYRLEEAKVEKMLKDLESISQNDTTSNKSSFFRPEVLIPTGALVLLFAVAIGLVIRKRKQAKVKR